MGAHTVLTALGAYYAVVNVLTAVLFAVDKHRARRGQWRISEKTLLGLSLIGGALGGLVAMRAVRHKTRKPAFAYGLPLMLVLHVMLMACLVYADGRVPDLLSADTAGVAAGEKSASADHAAAGEAPGGSDAPDGDAAGLPPLDGSYAYVRARVVARDADSRTLTVEVEPWEGAADGVNVSSLEPGTEGQIDCSDLLTVAGIKEGAAWIFSYRDAGQASFPVTVVSIESPESFAERVAGE